MSKYNSFLAFFLIAVAGSILFFFFYLTQMFTFVAHAHELNTMPPEEAISRIFSTIFSPTVIISAIILSISSIVYRVLGIVYVAKNSVKDGEKTLWIIGFILFGFITGIVFLVMAKGKGLTN